MYLVGCKAFASGNRSFVLVKYNKHLNCNGCLKKLCPLCIADLEKLELQVCYKNSLVPNCQALVWNLTQIGAFRINIFAFKLPVPRNEVAMVKVTIEEYF